DVAAEFARRSGGAWRIPGSGGVHDLVVVALADHPHSAPGPPGTAPGPGTGVGPRGGWIDTADGLVTLRGVGPGGVGSARPAGGRARREAPRVRGRAWGRGWARSTPPTDS